MLKLSDDFYIVCIKNRDKYKESKLNKYYIYEFRYKDYLLSLDVSFEIVGYTREDNIAILNFGYLIDIEKWSNREQRFKWIVDLDSQCGKSTKKYLDSKEAREIIFRFVERSIKKFIKFASPSIIINGTHNKIKANLPKYKRLDSCFLQYKYIKQKLNKLENKSLYEIIEKQDDDPVIWAYYKKEHYLVQLKDVFK